MTKKMTAKQIEQGFECMHYLIKNQQAIIESMLWPTWPPRGIKNGNERN